LAAAYQRHHQALYRYCRSILRHEHDAQDALQSTMARAFAAVPNTPRESELRPWLFRIAHNEAVSILRRRRPVVELDTEVADLHAVDERVETDEKLRLLRQDLADLPERQRAALVLRELCGLSTAEIAAILETTPGAVKQLILEARRALSKCAEGRATPCFDVQHALSAGDGRVLRARGVRAHLRSCAGCRTFRADLQRRPGELAALAPPLPAGVGAALLASLPEAAVGGGAAGSALLAKAAIAVIVTTGAATGAQSLAEPAPAPPARTAPPAPAADAPGAHAHARPRAADVRVAGDASPRGDLAPAQGRDRQRPAAAPRFGMRPTRTLPAAERASDDASAADRTTETTRGPENTEAAPRQVKTEAPAGQGRPDSPTGEVNSGSPQGQGRPQSPPGQSRPGSPSGQGRPASPPGQAEGRGRSESAPGQANAPPGPKNEKPPGQAKTEPAPPPPAAAPEAHAPSADTPQPPDAPGKSGGAPGSSRGGPDYRPDDNP
jgi:RNA polymerase sigma factor (sigma-70 family)